MEPSERGRLVVERRRSGLCVRDLGALCRCADETGTGCASAARRRALAGLLDEIGDPSTQLIEEIRAGHRRYFEALDPDDLDRRPSDRLEFFELIDVREDRYVCKGCESTWSLLVVEGESVPEFKCPRCDPLFPIWTGGPRWRGRVEERCTCDGPARVPTLGPPGAPMRCLRCRLVVGL